MYFLWYLLIGLAAGWIASLIFKGSGSGLLVNLIVGLVGGFWAAGSFRCSAGYQQVLSAPS